MRRNLAALISLAIVFSGSFALSTQSVEAKTSRNNSSTGGNYFVPPPPPYTPSLDPWALGMTFAQAVTANADNAVVEKFALSTQSVEVKTSRHSSRRARNYFVPPPPPYTPSMVPLALGMMNAQAITANQVVQPNPFVSYHPVLETKILKQIDDFDSEISSHEKEIGKLLNL